MSAGARPARPALDRPLEGRALKIIGLGGIGAPLARALAHFLFSQRSRSPLFLVDGDRYEEANRSRVLFKSLDNKAISLSAELSTLTEGAVAIVPVPRFVSPANVHRLVGERDVVFLAVDNHATRRCVSNRCRRLAEVLLISGGNDGLEDNRSGTFGNVMVYLRKRSRDQTSPLSRFHPEIARPQDKRPDELSCEELARAGAPQLLFTNLAVAAAMLQPFYGWLSRSLDYEELCLDIGKGRMTPVRRSARRVKRKL